MKGLRVVFASGLLVSALALAGPASAQPAAGGGQPPAPPRNLKVLKPEDVRASMAAFTAALGVQCNYCHVIEGTTRDMASDDKQTKKTARLMLEMVGHANEMIGPGVGKPVAEVTQVRCWTCHRGKAIPDAPPPPAPAAPPAGAQAPR